MAKEKDKEEEHIPTREEALAAFAPALSKRHSRARDILHRLRPSPPQVMVMEGGTVEERTAMALWYAALHSCSAVSDSPEALPCLACADCLRVGAGFHADVARLDGREGSIRIDDVRELRASLGEAPRGDGKRAVLLLEAQALGVEAANALLKSLEEPRENLIFALMTPQRDRLLPTLVSRGWTLTLAWPDIQSAVPADLAPWVRALDDFLRSGAGLFAQTSVKGGADAQLGRELILCVQKTLAAVMTDPAARPNPLADHFSALPPGGWAYITDVLSQAQASLDAMVNPALVLDWMGVRLFQAVNRRRR